VEEGIEEYSLSGFDPAGEPMVRRTAAGRLWLCLQFVPPSWVPHEERTGRDGLGEWADFDRRLARETRVPVVWEDREWFRIDQPREDTVRAIHRFLLQERQRSAPDAPRPINSGIRPTPEPFRFDHVLDEGGWATSSIGIGGREVPMQTVAMNDSLASLAKAILRLDAGEPEATAVFMDQLGEHQCVFRRAEATVALTVWWFEDWESWGLGSPDQCRVVLEGSCLFGEVRQQVVAALERVLAEHGLAGYRAKALEYDFPLEALQSLEHAAPDAASDRRDA
jgi:hypothetical protein